MFISSFPLRTHPRGMANSTCSSFPGGRGGVPGPNLLPRSHNAGPRFRYPLCHLPRETRDGLNFLMLKMGMKHRGPRGSGGTAPRAAHVCPGLAQGHRRKTLGLSGPQNPDSQRPRPRSPCARARPPRDRVPREGIPTEARPTTGPGHREAASFRLAVRPARGRAVLEVAAVPEARREARVPARLLTRRAAAGPAPFSSGVSSPPGAPGRAALRSSGAASSSSRSRPDHDTFLETLAMARR